MGGCQISKDETATIDHLIMTINDQPDKLHGDNTPAVRGLIKIGKPAIPKLLDLMISGDTDTRLRAATALWGITANMYGAPEGQGWRRPEDEARWRARLDDLGSLDWRDPQPKRETAVALWRQWYKKQ